MGLFDKIKDVAKDVAKTATDKISAIQEEKEKEAAKKAEKAAAEEAKQAAIQDLLCYGLLTDFNGISCGTGYDMCLDDENSRIVLREKASGGKFKYELMNEYSYEFVSDFRYIRTRENNSGNGYVSYLYTVQFEIFGNFTIDIVLYRGIHENKTEETIRSEKFDRYKILRLFYRFAMIVKDDDTKNWINSIMESYDLYAIFDENGNVTEENLKRILEKYAEQNS